MLYTLEAGGLGVFLAHGRQYGRVGLASFVASSWGFIRPGSEHEQGEIATSIFFFPSSHSPQAIIVEKKGILCKALPFSASVLLLTSKNRTRITHFVKKESYLSLFVLASLVNEALRWRRRVD